MKTISLKKVSAVAVASLGFGLLSVVPAQATSANSTTWTVYRANVTSINLKLATASPKADAAIYVNMGAVTTASNPVAAAAATAPLTKYQAVLTSYPSGGFVTIAGSTNVEGATAGTQATVTNSTVVATAASFTGSVTGNSLFQKATTVDDTLATAITYGGDTVLATATTGMGSFTFTPTVAGTYVMTVWNDGPGTGVTTVGNGAVDASEAQQQISITVAAAADLVPAASVVNMTGITGGAAASSATNAIPRSAAATAGTHIAQVKVNLVLSTGAADTRNHTLTCEISGAGYCGIGAVNTDLNVTTRSATNSTGATDRYVGIESDGVAGTGTVTIYVTHLVSGVRTQIYTGSYTSYGDVTKLAISTTNYTIGKAAATTGAIDANLGARTGAGNLLFAQSATATVPAFIVKMTDAGGRTASRGTAPTVISSNASVVTGGTCVLDDGSAVATGDSSSTNGVGFYNCNFKTSASAKSGDKATLTLRVTDPADTTVYLTTTLDVTVGGSAGTETITFDKAAYAAGEAMTITRTCKDTSGNPCADGTAAPAITFSKSVGGTAPGDSQYVGGKKSSTSSTGVVSVFAPAIAGAFSANSTSSNAAGSAITASVTVTDANAGLLTQIDALNAKIVALNALIAKIMKKLGVK